MLILANPKIVSARGNVMLRESCASMPHFQAWIARAAEITVDGYEPGSGRAIRIVADGPEARCILHVLDHLDGRTLMQRMREES